MKKYFLLSMLSIVIMSLNSCKKDPFPVASFSMNKTTCRVGETIIFTNLSKNATDYIWYFGDGFNTTAENPTHSFSSVGTFEIELYAYSVQGVKSTSKTISVSQ